jgi:hypothetical protein
MGASKPSGAELTTIPSPSGGAVTVTEFGFSPTPNKKQISMGAVLTNSSTQVAYRTRIFFRAFTRKGANAISDGSHYFGHIEIPIIRPGDRVPVGDTLFVNPEQFNKTGVPLAVASARLDLVSTQWAPATATATFPAVTAKLISANPPSIIVGAVTVPFTATSDACRNLGGRGDTAVLRDQQGAIVGGVFDSSEQTGGCAAGEFGGSVATVDPKPSTADLARTEVSVFCDVAPSSFARPGPDQPRN